MKNSEINNLDNTKGTPNEHDKSNTASNITNNEGISSDYDIDIELDKQFDLIEKEKAQAVEKSAQEKKKDKKFLKAKKEIDEYKGVILLDKCNKTAFNFLGERKVTRSPSQMSNPNGNTNSYPLSRNVENPIEPSFDNRSYDNIYYSEQYNNNPKMAQNVYPNMPQNVYSNMAQTVYPNMAQNVYPNMPPNLYPKRPQDMYPNMPPNLYPNMPSKTSNRIRLWNDYDDGNFKYNPNENAYYDIEEHKLKWIDYNFKRENYLMNVNGVEKKPKKKSVTKKMYVKNKVSKSKKKTNKPKNIYGVPMRKLQTKTNNCIRKYNKEKKNQQGEYKEQK